MIATTLTTPVTTSRPPVAGEVKARKKAVPESSQTKRDTTHPARLTSTRAVPSSAAHPTTQSVQQKLEAFWQRWHKALTLAGATLGVGTLGFGMAYLLIRHADVKAPVTKNNSAREVGQFREELDNLQEMVSNAIHYVTPGSKTEQAGKQTTPLLNKTAPKFNDTFKDKFVVANLMQEAFNLSGLKQSASITSEEASELKAKTVTLGLQYAMLFDRDQLPSLIRQVYANKAFDPEILKNLNVRYWDQVGIPGAHEYLKGMKKLSPADKSANIRQVIQFDIGEAEYHQTHMALSYLTKYGAAKEARQLLLENGNLTFWRTETNYKTPESYAEVAAMLDLYGIYFRHHDPDAYFALMDLSKAIFKHSKPADVALDSDRHLLDTLENRLGITHTEPLENRVHSSATYRSERLRQILMLRLQESEPTPNNQISTNGNAPYLALNHYMDDVARRLAPEDGTPATTLRSQDVQHALRAIKSRYAVADELHNMKHFMNFPGEVETHLATIHQFAKAVAPHLPATLKNNASFMNALQPYITQDATKLAKTMASLTLPTTEPEMLPGGFSQALDAHTERFHLFLNDYWMPVLKQIVNHAAPETHQTPKTLPTLNPD